MEPRRRIWIRQRRWWWSAIDPDEALATFDTHTVLRSRTREGVIAKWRERLAPRVTDYEEVEL